MLRPADQPSVPSVHATLPYCAAVLLVFDAGFPRLNQVPLCLSAWLFDCHCGRHPSNSLPSGVQTCMTQVFSSDQELTSSRGIEQLHEKSSNKRGLLHTVHRADRSSIEKDQDMESVAVFTWRQQCYVHSCCMSPAHSQHWIQPGQMRPQIELTWSVQANSFLKACKGEGICQQESR